MSNERLYLGTSAFGDTKVSVREDLWWDWNAGGVFIQDVKQQDFDALVTEMRETLPATVGVHLSLDPVDYSYDWSSVNELVSRSSLPVVISVFVPQNGLSYFVEGVDPMLVETGNGSPVVWIVGAEWYGVGVDSWFNERFPLHVKVTPRVTHLTKLGSWPDWNIALVDDFPYAKNIDSSS